MAKINNKKVLEDKFLLCDPLPDAEDEKDLTTFITLWKEQVETSLKESVDGCQMALDVIRNMQDIYGDSLAEFKLDKQEWCKEYMTEMREIILKKYDIISAHILEYIE
mmetsp:Transcript_24178/g.23757  ORF Transcript_24178/g.23757 Transcript_24178/m.23757 type:complete len:108 (+) Transcript_24178:245-568(+)